MIGFSGHRFKFALAAGTALASTIAAAPAWAQSHAFNIPVEPAQRGVSDFARQAEVQILISQEDAAGRMTNPVKGSFDVATGLRMLLSGTGLEARPTGEATFTVVRAKAQKPVVTPTSADVPEDTATSVDTVVVTGRVGSLTRTRADTSYSISVIPEERLRETEVSSVADSLRNIPGFWVENSGGEASANVRARGIPVDGFSSIQLEEDGMPIQHDPGLGYLNADQSFRLDETISQIQVVRGGPSTVFAPNAPGGVVNYITRKPTNEASGVAKLTLGDDGLYRGDFWYGGPVGDWKVAVGGFYRVERGVRDPGYNFNDGGQFRLQASHEVGNGLLELDYKHIDDKVGFYLPIPIAANGSGGVTSVPGFNASTGILNGPTTETLNLLTDKGRFDLRINDGTDVKLDQFTFHLTQDLAGWHMDNHFRFRTTDQARIGLYTGSVQTGAARLAALLPSVQTLFPQAASLQFRYVNSPSTVFTATQNGNGLEVDNNARQVSLTEHEAMDDLRFSRTFDLFGQTHDITVGGYVMTAHETFNRYSAVVLQDVRNRALLMNVVALDAAGNVIGNATDNGVLRYGSEFADGQGDQVTGAAYVADEWQVTDSLRIDAGVRYEQMHTNGSSQGTQTVNLGVTNTLADRTYLTGNGVWTPYSDTFHTFTWTLGANWQFDKAQGLFARVTQAARMPSISDFITNPTNQNAVISHTDMYEAGYKLSRSWADLYLTLFDTEYHNYGVSENVYDNATATYLTQTYFADTRDYGLEIDGIVRPVSWFDISFTGTIQNPTFTSLNYTVLSNGTLQTLDFNGNQLLRIPKTSFSVSPTVHLFDDKLMAQVTVEHYSDRFADAANSQLLPDYTVVNLTARYKISDDMTLYLDGYNLSNAIGLTEGNPRSGEVQSSQAGAPVFLARPIVGRNFRMSLLYKF